MVAKKKPKLFIICGLSGAGRSTAIHFLEDRGFFCMDNLPDELMNSALKYVVDNKDKLSGFAFGINPRNNALSKNYAALKKKLSPLVDLFLVFLTAHDDVLMERFASTKRLHPFAFNSKADLPTMIAKERRALTPLKKQADLTIDTSTLSPKELQKIFEQSFLAEFTARILQVVIKSFGFKHGVPKSIEGLVDVRFLKNPYYDLKLRKKTGLDNKVKEYVLSSPAAGDFVDHLASLYFFLLPKYHEEGLNYFRLAVGCTGGKHRSVCIAEELYSLLIQKNLPNIAITVKHRDLER